MKRSEALAIKRQRELFGTEYSCFSIKQDDDKHDGEAYFSSQGCDVCESGAADVFDVIYLANADIAKKIFNKVHDGQICGGCLCSLVNGDDSDLDFSVTEEDAP